MEGQEDRKGGGRGGKDDAESYLTYFEQPFSG